MSRIVSADYRSRPVVNRIQNPSLEVNNTNWAYVGSGDAPGESAASRVSSGGHDGSVFGRQTWLTKPGGTDIGSEIRDIALDPTGAFLYAATYGGSKLWKFSASMGDSAYDSNVFSSGGQRSMAVDSLGNIWVSKTLNSPTRTEIEKRSSAGALLATITGTSSGYGSNFGDACKIVIDSADNVYVAEPQANKVIKLDSSGTYVLQWGSQGQTDGLFDMYGFMPGIAVGPSDDIFVTGYDYGGPFRCQRFTSAGVFVSKTVLTTNTLIKMPIRAVDGSGDLYVTSDASSDRGKLIKRSQANVTLMTINVANTTGDVNYTVGPTVLDSSGNIYAYSTGLSNDQPQNRIRKYDSSGTYLGEIIRLSATYTVGGYYRLGGSGTLGSLSEVLAGGTNAKYGASIWVRSSVSQRVRINIEYSSFFLSTLSSPAVVLTANTWTQLVYENWNFAAASNIRISVETIAGTGATIWSPGDTFDMDGACLYEYPRVNTDYFDGTTARFGWSGTANNSYSVGYPTTTP